jgi:hypothetical protein
VRGGDQGTLRGAGPHSHAATATGLAGTATGLAGTATDPARHLAPDPRESRVGDGRATPDVKVHVPR